MHRSRVRTQRVIATVAASLLIGGIYTLEGQLSGLYSQRTAAVPPCISGQVSVSPNQIFLGDAASGFITLTSQCEERGKSVADIVFLADTSESIGFLSDTMGAIRWYTSEIDISRQRVALVSFANEARIITRLTTDQAMVKAEASKLRRDGDTNMDAGLRAAADVLRDSPSDRRRVIALFTDGMSGEEFADPLSTAEELRRDGVIIYLIAEKSAATKEHLASLAGSPDRVFEFVDSNTANRTKLFDRILDRLLYWSVREVGMRSEFNEVVGYVPGSSLPLPIEENENRAKWIFGVVNPVLPGISFQIVPKTTGILQVHTIAEASYMDSDSNLVRVPLNPGFVEVMVVPSATPDVIEPTETSPATATVRPSASPTATATQTQSPMASSRPPAHLYLPLALRERCPARGRPVELLLVIDTSISMSERLAPGTTKLDATIRAAQRLLEIMRMDGDGDRVAVIGFNSAATLQVPLSSSKILVSRALNSLTVRAGTRIDLGMEVAVQEATVHGRRNATQALIVLSDGRTEPKYISAILELARQASTMGLLVFSVGFGSAHDAETLRAIVTRPSYYSEAENEASLYKQFEGVTKTVQCPSTGLWSQR